MVKAENEKSVRLLHTSGGSYSCIQPDEKTNMRSMKSPAAHIPKDQPHAYAGSDSRINHFGRALGALDEYHCLFPSMCEVNESK